MTSVYLAAALSTAERVEAIASRLRDSFRVVSTWHARNKVGARDPRNHELREAICQQNLAELCGADVIVCLVDEGEPRATYGELGYALALCKGAVVAHDSGTGRCILDAHPLVVRLDLRTESLSDLPRAIGLAGGLVLVPREERPTWPASAPAPSEEAERLVGADRNG